MNKIGGFAALGFRAVLLATCAVLPVQGFAQTSLGTGTAGPNGLSDIVVTARKTEERLQDVPVAITALSNEDLESRSMADLRDVGRFTQY